MKTSAAFLLLGLITLTAQAQDKGPGRVDLLKVQDITIDVADEVDHGYTCETYRLSSGMGIQENQHEGHCPANPKETYGKAWARNHFMRESHHRSKTATPVIRMKDGSEIRLESVTFDRYKETADQEEWGSLPWGYENPLSDWLESAQKLLEDAHSVYNVYSTIPCYRMALSKELGRDQRAGGTNFFAQTTEMYVDCSTQNPDSIIVIKK